MRKSITMILFGILFFNALTAQQAVIKGNITDGDNTPLEFVNVLLLHSKDSTLHKGAVTDALGSYSIDQVQAGSYLIKASMVGLGDASSDIFEVAATETYNAPTMALSDGIEMEEITVTAKKPFIELKADKMVVNVENSSVNAGNSALEVLQKSPGVQLDNNNNISLRGKQGVLVMINGKNQYLSGEELIRLLENMPSSNIKNIEIITNPSAKYDAEGNSGIINIILKKNENLGTNGTLSTTFRQGRKTSSFNSLSLNNRTEKVNIYGKVQYNNWGWAQDLNLLRNIAYEGGNTVFDQASDMSERGHNYRGRLGIDWMVTPSTTVGLMTKYREGSEDDTNENTTNISGDNMPEFSRLFVDTKGVEDTESSTINANVVHNFNEEGLTLTVDADLSRYSNENDYLYDNFYRNTNDIDVRQPFYLSNDQRTVIDIFATTVDLSIPVSDRLKVETGAKLSKVSTDNSTVFRSKDENGKWIDMNKRSNDFIYDEDVWAGYINGSSNIGAYMIQGGLRLEHTESRGVSKTVNSDIPRSYTDLFPSVSVSRQFGDRHNVSVTYSRRLERPNYKNMNPFEEYLDQYTFSKGNPYLNPQYSNAFGVNYSMGNALFVAANYSHTTDQITEFIEQQSATNTTFQTNKNLANSNSGSLTISMPKVWTEWWTSRASYTGFYNEFTSPLDNGTYLDSGSFGHHINLSNDIQLTKSISMEVSGWYQSALTYGQIDLDPRGRVDVGFATRLLDNKLKVKLNVNDIFLTSNSPATINRNGVNIIVDQTHDSRRASLTLSYSFGNQKVKKARDRQTSSTDASGRI